MHPILASRRNLALYASAWTLLAAILTGWFGATGLLPARTAIVVVFPSLALYASVCLSPWYLCRMLPIGRTSATVLIANHLGAAMFIAGLWIVIVGVLVRNLPDAAGKADTFLPLLYFVGLLLYVLSTLFHYLLVSMEASRAAELAARDSQLKALRMQINPHFLFNSLNSISALATIDGPRARDMCIKLSDMLRKTLQVGDRPSIRLEEEIALALNYLEVERVRFGDRLRIEKQIEANCGDCSVPPLIIQPLVENAVKHGIAGMVEGGSVRLDVRCGNGRLLVSVSNPFDPEMPAPRKSGVGLINVRQRLSARYGPGASLDVDTRNSVYRAVLQMPCAEMQDGGSKATT